MFILREAVRNTAWIAKAATVLVILFIISLVVLSPGRKEVVQSIVDMAHVNHMKIASHSGSNMPSQGNTSLTAFASNCKTEDLFTVQYSKDIKAAIPVPTGGKTVCPRRLETPSFPLPYTGLLTFPGSGNTWTRHLLQELTGLPTGSSSIPDEVLRVNGFPSEGKLEGVIAVKSHGQIHAKYDYYVPTNDFSRLIVVVRSPFNCFLSEYKRHNSKGSHSVDVHIVSGTNYWRNFISKRMQLWKMFYDDVFNFPGPIFVTFYEDLQSQLLTELIRLSEFLGSKKVSEFSFCCALENDVGNFRRPKSNQTIEEIYPQADKMRINSLIEKTSTLLRNKLPELSKRMNSYKLAL